MTDNRSNSDPTPSASQPPGPSKWDGLSVRIITLLTIALLPLGLISVLQTQRSNDAAAETYRTALAAQTWRAAQPERESIVSAFTTARAIANTLAELQPAVEACRGLLSRTAGASDGKFAFVGYIENNAISRCNNQGEVFDFSSNEEAVNLLQNPEPYVTFNPSGDATGLPVIIVSQPVYLTNGDLAGLVSLSFSGHHLVAERAQEFGTELRLVSFDGQGRILTTDVPREELDTILPANVALSSFVGGGRQLSSGLTQRGQLRDFAVVPILPGEVYALGSWERAPSGLVASPISTDTLLFPLLMWGVTLIVAVWALRRQVIVPIRMLQMRMRGFADGRNILRGNSIEDAPNELREIGLSFERMAEIIIRDEARLEDKLYERDLLLREVHHRVKNNLQLMTSIINMQIRQAQGTEAEGALQSIQNRLASLAKFHQDLYKTSSLSELRADQLIEDLARQMMTMGADPSAPIDLRLELDEIVLPPDQVSPLAMLATEALTNALKYADADPGQDNFVRVSLRQAEAGTRVVLEIENSVCSDSAKETPTGLGTRLITAFGSQLEAEVEHRHDAHRYLLSVAFALSPASPDQ